MAVVFQNSDPPIPLSPWRVCTPRLCNGGRTDSPGGEGDGGSIFWNMREIGLPSYSKICTLWRWPTLERIGKVLAQRQLITSLSLPPFVFLQISNIIFYWSFYNFIYYKMYILFTKVMVDSLNNFGWYNKNFRTKVKTTISEKFFAATCTRKQTVCRQRKCLLHLYIWPARVEKPWQTISLSHFHTSFTLLR